MKKKPSGFEGPTRAGQREVWRPIRGYDGFYEVSGWGGVRSLDRVVIIPASSRCRAYQRLQKGKLLKLTSDPKGYVMVGLHCAGTSETRLVHRLVLEAFVGPCPEGMETLHENGIPGDNRVENLSWGTPVNNAADRKRHGTDQAGERNWNTDLTVAKVIEIRERVAGGESTDEVAEHFGISQAQVSRIAAHRSWCHVKEGPVTGGRTDLTKAKVIEIRDRRAAGEPSHDLAEFFEISRNQVNSIAAHRSWRHIKEGPVTAGVLRGERHCHAKLTVEKVIEIRRRVAGGESQCKVARSFEVGKMTVSRIVRRTRWAHVA